MFKGALHSHLSELFSSPQDIGYIYETSNFIKSFFITCVQKYENIYIQNNVCCTKILKFQYKKNYIL